MSKDFVSLRLNRKGADRLLEAVQHAAPHLAPVLAAAAERLIDVVLVERGGHFPGVLNGTTKNVLAIIGDDDGTPSGPAGFPSAVKFCRWAKAAVLHATGAEPEHYREAVRAAVSTGRCLMVETTPAHENAWLEMLVSGRPIPVLHLRAKGGRHPLPLKPEDVQ
jgi:hypothetical protein